METCGGGGFNDLSHLEIKSVSLCNSVKNESAVLFRRHQTRRPGPGIISSNVRTAEAGQGVPFVVLPPEMKPTSAMLSLPAAAGATPDALNNNLLYMQVWPGVMNFTRKGEISHNKLLLCLEWPDMDDLKPHSSRKPCFDTKWILVRWKRWRMGGSYLYVWEKGCIIKPLSRSLSRFYLISRSSCWVSRVL